VPPKLYRVILTEKAYDGLRRIRDHIARNAPDTAADAAGRILQECYDLEVLPHRGTVRRRRKAPGEVRQLMVAKSFRILFAVSDADTNVTILNVQHGSRSRWR
jgi:plasmid stabilization system protein ParE